MPLHDWILIIRLFKLTCLGAGLLLLIFVINETDLAETRTLLRYIGAGFLIILFLYFTAFLLDTISWQLTLPTVQISFSWIIRFFNMRLAGEAFNNTLPIASLGGEPVKAILMHKHYGFDYRESVASLILAKTINTIALVLFLSIGFLLVMQSENLASGYKSIAGTGLIVFAIAIALFYIVQRYGIATRVSVFFSKWSLFSWTGSALHHIQDMDARLSGFYVDHKGRFSAALILAFINWILGVAEIYVTMLLLGHPISLTDAWIIEATAQLIRAGTFFIPASLGAQEGAFMVIGAAITGSPTVGFATAIVRRLREIIWITWGLATFYLLKPPR